MVMVLRCSKTPQVAFSAEKAMASGQQETFSTLKPGDSAKLTHHRTSFTHPCREFLMYSRWKWDRHTASGAPGLGFTLSGLEPLSDTAAPVQAIYFR